MRHWRAAVGLAVAGACTVADTTSTDQASIACANGPTLHGMDVSSYDTVDDWATAHAAGIDFAFVRVSDGLQYIDPTFASHWAGAKAAGVIRGAYQFFRPTQDAVAQADLLLEHIGAIEPGDLPPVLDVEVSGGAATEHVTAAIHAWIARVAATIGRQPIVYAGLYSWPELTGGADLTTSPLWVAQYTTAACPDIPRPWTQWTFWQTSATGSSPGVAGGGMLDLDVFAGSHDDLVAFAAAEPPPCGTIGAAGGEIDDADPCFVAGGPPAYVRAVDGAGQHGTLRWTRTTSATREANFAQWNLVVERPGRYRVEVYTDRAYATSRAAAYEVYATDVPTAIVIDQTAADGWQSLGAFELRAGSDQWVHLSDNTGEPTPMQLVFDALRVTPVAPPDAPSDDAGSAAASGCSTGGTPGLLVIVVLGAVRRRKAVWRLDAFAHRHERAQLRATFGGGPEHAAAAR